MKYYIPKYTPIYRSGDKICIGFVNNMDRYTELDFTEASYLEIEKILKYGIDSVIDSSDLFTQLLNKNVIVTAENINTSQHHRGLLFLDYLGNHNFELVKNTRILIFGAGAIGGTLAYLLAQFGFTDVHIVDFDTVNPSDIQKLTIFDKTQIGKLKVDAIKEKVSQNFNQSISTHDVNLLELGELTTFIKSVKPDFIVKACDPDLIFRVNLNKIAHTAKIPHFHIAYSFENVKIGPLYFPDYMGCDECLNLTIQHFYGVNHAFENSKRLFRDMEVHPSISFNINLAANFALKEIIFFLTQQIEYCFSICRVVEINSLSLQLHQFEVNKHEQCTVCNLNPAVFKP